MNFSFYSSNKRNIHGVSERQQCVCVSAGIRRSLHGDQRQVRSQRRAGFHCCGEVSIVLTSHWRTNKKIIILDFTVNLNLYCRPSTQFKENNLYWLNCLLYLSKHKGNKLKITITKTYPISKWHLCHWKMKNLQILTTKIFSTSCLAHSWCPACDSSSLYNLVGVREYIWICTWLN